MCFAPMGTLPGDELIMAPLDYPQRQSTLANNTKPKGEQPPRRYKTARRSLKP